MSGQIYEAMGLKSAALKEYYLSTQKEKAWSMPWLLAARLHLEFYPGVGGPLGRVDRESHFLGDAVQFEAISRYREKRD